MLIRSKGRRLWQSYPAQSRNQTIAQFDAQCIVCMALLVFVDISITPACDMAPKIVIVTPLAVGTMPLAGVPFRERP
jgi:hypothetical protein